MTVTKHGDGWLVRGRTIPSSKTGKRSEYKRLLRGPKSAALALDAELSQNDPDKADASSFRSFARVWVDSHREWSDATRDYYKRGLESLGEVSSIRIDRVSAYDCERALLSIPTGSCRKRARKALTAALNHAVKLGVIDRNPMSRVDVPDGCPPPRRDRYTPEECAVIIEAVRGDRIEPAVLLSMLCGLRREEVCGLAWEDIDLERGVVNIRRACVEVGGSVHVKDTKTASSRRSVPLTGYTLERMREIGRGRSGCVLPARARPVDGHGNPVLCTVLEPRAHMRPRSVSRRFLRIVDRAGLRRVPFENLRHTFATAAVEAGVPATALQAILGHTRFATTAGYVASLHTDSIGAISAVGERLAPAQNKESKTG